VHYWLVYSAFVKDIPPGALTVSDFRQMTSLVVRTDTLMALRWVYGVTGPELLFRDEGVYHISAGQHMETEAPVFESNVAVYFCPTDRAQLETSPRRLSFRDFIVGGVPATFDGYSRVDEPTVRAAFGQPDSVVADEALIRWYYDGLEVELIDTAVGPILSIGSAGPGVNLYAVTLSAPRWTTYRGIGVGDSSEAVLQAYGEPAPPRGTEWHYFRGRVGSTTGIAFHLKDGRVERIRIGYRWGGY